MENRKLFCGFQFRKEFYTDLAMFFLKESCYLAEAMIHAATSVSIWKIKKDRSSPILFNLTKPIKLIKPKLMN
jgi:hypothetical protein